MKKLLIGSSTILAVLALAGAAQAAEPLTLSVGGFANFFGGYAEDAYAGAMNKADMIDDTEIHFRADATLDNGMKTGAVVQMRAGVSDNSTVGTDYIKRTYGFFDSKFGRLVYGATEGAAFQMAAGDVDVGVLGMNETDLAYMLPSLNAQDNPLQQLSTSVYDSIDGALLNTAHRKIKMTYFTPVFAGLQAGVTYIPGSAGTGFDKTFKKGVGDIRQGYEAAVAFTHTTDDFMVKVSTGYGRYDISAADSSWQEEYAAGLNLGFGPVTLSAGGRYIDPEDTAAGSYGHAINAGIAYEQGRFGVSFMAEQLTASPANFNFKIQDYLYLASAKYNLMAGVDVFSSVGYIYYDNMKEDRNISTAGKQEAFTAIGGIALTF
jgi:hypothetical protein